MNSRPRLGRHLAPVSLLALLAAGPGAAEAANVGFVAAEGGRFTRNGAPFYFVGTNAYYLMVAAAWGSTAHTDETMALANQLGFTVLRAWAFYDGGTDGLALQPSPGVYNESSFQALDYVLDQADRHDVRLILPLVNGPPDFGGMEQYVRWCAPGQSRLAFYTNGTCRRMYQDYVRHVLTRVNTLNGRRYADDPTVFAWELANEPDLPDNADPTGLAIRDWVAVMAAFIKSIDGNHMVGTGEMGMDTTAAGYSSLGGSYNNQAWLFNGTKGVSFSLNTAVPQIDFGSIHLYPEYWNLGSAAGNAWIADHARIAAGLGKPLLLGEFGATQNTAAVFDTWLGTADTEQVGGSLMWQLMCQTCYGMRDQFGVAYPPAGAVSDALARAAATADAKSVAPPPPVPGGFTVGASATPAAVVNGQTVTVTAAVTAAAAAAGTVVDLEIHAADGTRVAQQVYGGQDFAAGQTWTYSWGWPVPAGLAAGTYTVAMGVLDASWATVYTWAGTAATLTVQAPAALTFQATATVAPTVVFRRQAVTVTTAVTASAGASAIIVDVEISNAAGTRVLQKVYQNQAFTPGGTQSYAFGWSTKTRGTYTVKVGIFDGTWQTLYLWVNQGATLVVQ